MIPFFFTVYDVGGLSDQPEELRPLIKRRSYIFHEEIRHIFFYFIYRNESMPPLLEFLGYEDHGVQWELFHDGYEFFFVEMAEKPAGVFWGQGADSGEQVSQGAGRFVAYGIF